MNLKTRNRDGKGMKFVVIITALALWQLSCAVKPEVKEEVRQLRGVELGHTNVVEHVGEDGPDIVVKVLSGNPDEVLKDDGLRLYFRERGTQSFATTYMGRAGVPSIYQASIPHFKRGTRVEYYIEVRGKGGELLTFPGNAGEGVYYQLRFKGHVPKPLLVAHIWTMFLGLLLFVIASYLSWKYLKAKRGYEGVERLSVYALIFLFIGGFPLGCLMGYYTSGVLWGGFPVGTDITDTKTLIVFLFWLIVIGFLRVGKRAERSEKAERRFANLIIWGTILTIIIYAIPHSI